MSPYVAEFIGTALLVCLGNGVVANVLLTRTKGSGSGWIVITAGWAIGVFVGVFSSQAVSGAHINPAVTIAMALGGKFEWGIVPGYLLAQLFGGMAGGALVYGFYREHFKLTSDADAKLACFATAPNVRNLPQAFFCEVIGTFVLVFPVFLMTDAKISFPSAADGTLAAEGSIGLGTLGALPVALLVFGIGLSLGGTTGYAINPARDLGPRMAHALLPIPNKRDNDWSYGWVPVIAPLLGGCLAALAYLALGRIG